MEKKDFYEFSPIRYFDKISNGGLKPGEIGLITAKRGLGKTSVLVQFGMDSLLAGKQLVHVSFDQHSSNVISWYSSVFSEIAKKKNISNASELKDQIMRERTILNFNPENFTLHKVINTINALKEAGISVSALVLDNIDIKSVSAEDMKIASDFAQKEQITVWLTATEESAELKNTATPEVLDKLSIVIHLAAKNGAVSLSVLKLRNETPTASLKLDAKTLLITDK